MGKERSKVNPERQRTRFSKEFKLEAVRLLELGQKPATQLALGLGAPQDARNSQPSWHQERGPLSDVISHSPCGTDPGVRSYLHGYDSVSEAKARIRRHMDFHCARRQNSSLDRQTPDEVYFQLPLLAAVA